MIPVNKTEPSNEENPSNVVDKKAKDQKPNQEQEQDFKTGTSVKFTPLSKTDGGKAIVSRHTAQVKKKADDPNREELSMGSHTQNAPLGAPNGKAVQAESDSLSKYMDIREKAKKMVELKDLYVIQSGERVVAIEREFDKVRVQNESGEYLVINPNELMGSRLYELRQSYVAHLTKLIESDERYTWGDKQQSTVEAFVDKMLMGISNQCNEDIEIKYLGDVYPALCMAASDCGISTMLEIKEIVESA